MNTIEKTLYESAGKVVSMNGYVCFYKGKKFEVYAESTYQAQTKCATENKIKKQYEITVVLAEKDGNQVTHIPGF